MVPHREPVRGGRGTQVVDREGEAWARRPFARTFDLLASQYGWTDEEILDLTMSRMRQAREIIWEREAEERRRDLTVRETELRTLTSFIAGAAGWKAGQKSAAKIRLLPSEKPKGVVDSATGLRMVPAEMVGSLFDGG